MKKIIVVLIPLFVSVGINAQNNKVAPASANLKVFNQAALSGDIPTAITALSYYVSEPNSNPLYQDTLSMLYMQQNSYMQAYYWADKRLKVTPDNLVLMEMKGLCLDKMNQPKEAISIFEKLYAKSKSPYHAYTLMELQYSIKRLAECLATATSTEQLVFKPEYVMTYNAGEQMGRTYLQAGVYNITGLALYDLDKKTESKKYFEMALALDSNFVLARQNLEAIKSIESGGANKVNPAGSNNPASPANKQN